MLGKRLLKSITTLLITCTTVFAANQKKESNLFLELGLARGSSFQTLSSKDLPLDIIDTSLHLGVGDHFTNNHLFRLFYSVDFSTSAYTGDGNGFAITPILNIGMTTKKLLNTFHIYNGIGVGLGFDTMQITGYTNNTKWTLDFFGGVKMYNMKAGFIIRHKSHSFVGPWEGSGNNIGYNGLMLSVAYVII